jgi:hypothetical protein
MTERNAKAQPGERAQDPDPAELEIDQANDEMGGPTTASHSAGLSSKLTPGTAGTAEDIKAGKR